MYINGEYVKGNIYFDKSFKDMAWGRPRNHNEYRADVTYNGERIRMRSRRYDTCVQFLLDLKQSHIDEYRKVCKRCGETFGLTAFNFKALYCPDCAKATKKKQQRTQDKKDSVEKSELSFTEQRVRVLASQGRTPDEIMKFLGLSCEDMRLAHEAFTAGFNQFVKERGKEVNLDEASISKAIHERNYKREWNQKNRKKINAQARARRQQKKQKIDPKSPSIKEDYRVQ